MRTLAKSASFIHFVAPLCMSCGDSTARATFRDVEDRSGGANLVDADYANVRDVPDYVIREGRYLLVHRRGPTPGLHLLRSGSAQTFGGCSGLAAERTHVGWRNSVVSVFAARPRKRPEQHELACGAAPSPMTCLLEILSSTWCPSPATALGLLLAKACRSRRAECAVGDRTWTFASQSE